VCAPQEACLPSLVACAHRCTHKQAYAQTPHMHRPLAPPGQLVPAAGSLALLVLKLPAVKPRFLFAHHQSQPTRPCSLTARHRHQSPLTSHLPPPCSSMQHMHTQTQTQTHAHTRSHTRTHSCRRCGDAEGAAASLRSQLQSATDQLKLLQPTWSLHQPSGALRMACIGGQGGAVHVRVHVCVRVRVCPCVAQLRHAAAQVAQAPAALVARVLPRVTSQSPAMEASIMAVALLRSDCAVTTPPLACLCWRVRRRLQHHTVHEGGPRGHGPAAPCTGTSRPKPTQPSHTRHGACAGGSSTGLPAEASASEVALLRSRCADAEHRLACSEERCLEAVRQLEAAKQRALEAQRYADEARRYLFIHD